MCGSSLLKHLLHLTLEIVYINTNRHARAHAHTSQTGDSRGLKEPPATEYSWLVPLFYCKSHLKGRELKGVIAADDSELIKAALVGT